MPACPPALPVCPCLQPVPVSQETEGMSCLGSGPPPPKTAMVEEYIIVGEPEARANSFVGTEEYLAPEIINGTGHSAPVDWWSFGILIFELLYGITPFRGERRDQTFENILTAPLQFPDKPVISPECQDLIAQLLVKDPAKRLGTRLGAEEIKQHAFFQGINWALLRNEPPPYIPLRQGGGPKTVDAD